VEPTTDRGAPLLVVAVVLAAVAGYVDAVCFGHLFDVFPANQSGNIIFFGVAIGDRDASQLWPSATAMVGFAIGAGAASLVRHRLTSPRGIGPTRLLLAVECVLVTVVAVAVGSITEVTALLDGGRAVLVLLALSISMGVQTEVLQAHAGVSVSTTYQTGALARIAENVAGAATDRSAAERRQRRGPLGILTVVLAGYIGGAALGAWLVGSWGGVLLVPIVVLVAIIATEPMWGGRPHAPPT
jgi:uncharacterized membrane protein YoaK (UPF0700 family)